MPSKATPAGPTLSLYRCRFADFVSVRDQCSLCLNRCGSARDSKSTYAMALSRITDDVLFVIIDALKIEDIIILGAASRRLRTVTTNEMRVWAPRLFTKELGLGSVGLDAPAYAALTSLGCSPRRLCLQSLPWRVVRDGSDDGKGKAYSWRPRGVPVASRLDQSSFLRTPVLDPKFWFRNFFRSHARRAQPTQLFATDSATPLPFSPDAAFLRARRKTEMATARAAAAEAALAAKRAEQAALEAELEKIKASVAELERIKASVGSLDE